LITGNDVIIHDDCVFKRPHDTIIGSHVAIDKGFYCSTQLEVRNYVHISPYVTTIGGANCSVFLDNFTFVAAGTKLVCGTEKYTEDGLIGATIPSKYRCLTLGKIVFEKFSGCGVNCVIMPNVVLAEGSVIGANSVVTKSTEPWTVYVGNPAKPIKIRPNKKILEYAKELGY
jgi:acetyltransferase-like isoleucine patch superfamily enzyme